MSLWEWCLSLWEHIYGWDYGHMIWTMNVDKKGILPKKACGGHLKREKWKKVIIIIIIIICGKDCTKEYQIKGIE
jgi:hypothetical protein